ncbi:FRG domain-containing protein [Streptococcus suis]|nr:FRG domain-containing protein [Streptococcus suis]
MNGVGINQKFLTFLSENQEASNDFLELFNFSFSQYEKDKIFRMSSEEFNELIKEKDQSIITKFTANFNLIRATLYSKEEEENATKTDASNENDLLKEFLSVNFNLVVEEIDDEHVVIKKSDSLLEKAEDYMSWHGDDEAIRQAFLSKYSEIPGEKVFIIQSLSDYLQQISNINQESGFFLSRGQEDCTFDLVPSLLRYPGIESQEKSLIDRFTRTASFYDTKILSKSKESIIAYGQHYGLPTKFLDFTEAHLLSLFFAIEKFNYDEKPSIVYFVDTEGYHNEIVKVGEPFFDFSDEKSLEHYREKYAQNDIFIKLEDSNERIHFQKGYFLKVSTKNSENLSVMLNKYTYCFLISQDNKEKIFNELFNIGINYESIYPDIDNLVKNIKHRKE